MLFDDGTEGVSGISGEKALEHREIGRRSISTGGISGSGEGRGKDRGNERVKGGLGNGGGGGG